MHYYCTYLHTVFVLISSGQRVGTSVFFWLKGLNVNTKVSTMHLASYSTAAFGPIADKSLRTTSVSPEIHQHFEHFEMSNVVTSLTYGR